MRMIFVNLPVKDTAKSKAFFAALGFTHNPQFSNENTTSIVIEENIIAMLLEEPRFSDFLKQPISNAREQTEVLLALSCSSRQEVEDLTQRAFAAGATPWKEPQDHGFMYGTSFQDIDGHVWELVWMDPSQVVEHT